MKYNNIAIIWQPHYMSDCFRVNVKKQRGYENYIIVCCSPSFNGLWKYEVEEGSEYDEVKNKSITCRCVPVSDCIYIGGFEKIKDKDLLKEIKNEQKKWLKATGKEKKPDWFI